MLVAARAFIFRNAIGNITYREVVDPKEGEDYIQGFCIGAEDLSTFRKDRILEFFIDRPVADARLNYFQRVLPKHERSLSKNRKRNTTKALEICSTRLKAQGKEGLVAFAEAGELVVRSSVISRLNIHCGTYKTGPKKLSRAKNQKVIVF